MERGQGDSWRRQCLEALHGCPMLHKELKDLMMMICVQHIQSECLIVLELKQEKKNQTHI